MAIRVEDTGEFAFGGLVTAAKWWDDKRITDLKITDKDYLKKAETYTYLILGGGATALSAFGAWRRYERWLEHVSHGFMYGLPGWLTEVIKSMQAAPTTTRSEAVRQANRILEQHRTKQLGQGSGTSRSYQREFESVAPHAF